MPASVSQHQSYTRALVNSLCLPARPALHRLVLTSRVLPGSHVILHRTATQELLGSEWQMFHYLAQEDQAAALQAVEAAVRTAHAVPVGAVDGEEGGGAVAAHGDLR